MSNASLKEQLQSLGLSAENKKHPHHKSKSHHHEKSPKSSKPSRPAWLEKAQYGVELLKAHFPKCFREMKEIQPLKIGIKQDLVKQLSSREDIVLSDKACMVNSLSYYVNSPAYHRRVVEGAVRIDLEGSAIGHVTAEEAKYSLDCRNAKIQKKKNNNKKEKISGDPSSEITKES